jgi:ABC-type multidrug transport system permease subunit
VTAIGVIAANTLAALGGAWWPIEITPEFMQTLQKFIPSGWAMDAMHKLISFEAGAFSAMPHLAVLLLGTLIIGWMGARRFKFQ